MVEQFLGGASYVILRPINVLFFKKKSTFLPYKLTHFYSTIFCVS